MKRAWSDPQPEVSDASRKRDGINGIDGIDGVRNDSKIVRSSCLTCSLTTPREDETSTLTSSATHCATLTHEAEEKVDASALPGHIELVRTLMKAPLTLPHSLMTSGLPTPCGT